MNRVQILQTILNLTNYDFNIIGLETKEMGQIAKRPLNGGLLANKLFNNHCNFLTTSLNEYLRNKIK